MTHSTAELDPASARAAPPASIWRRLARLLVPGETIQGALVLAALLCVFFGTPLARYDEVYYSSADLTQDFSLTRLQPGHQAGNKLLSDAVTQMQPWSMFNENELDAGRFPLWNTRNGAGCPHFANYQSAVLSPFSLPYYVLSFKAALIVTAFLKLFALGFFTFLFLKEIGTGQIAALIGATAFMFGGHNVLLLSFPHVPALVALPAGLLFVEKACLRLERAQGTGAQPRLLGPLVGLALALATGLLAGNPEPFYFALFLLSAYVAVRLFGLALAARRVRAPFAPVARLASKLALAGLIGGGLAAVQVLPFFEYLERCRLIEQRSFAQTPLDPSHWPLAVFPDVIGNPATRYNLSYLIPPPNYELVNMAYVGGTVLFLAGLALLFAPRDRRIRFFAIAAATWACYAYDFLGAARWFALIPTVDRAPMNRSQGVWIFCLAILAALAVDRLTRRERHAGWNGALATALGALAFLVVFLIGADRLIGAWAGAPSPNHHLFPLYVPGHVRWFGRLFALGAAAATLIWLVPIPRWRAPLALAILAAVFLQTGHHYRDYNPVTENRFFFPVTPAITALQEEVGSHQLAILGEDHIPSASNLAYRISTISNYDGMWVRDYDHLFRVAFGDGNNWRPILKGSERMLKVFGVEYVLAKWGWIHIDSGLSRLVRVDDHKFVRHEIVPRQEIAQTFLSHLNGLQAVAVYLSCHPSVEPCTLSFRLLREDTGEVVCEREITSEQVRADVYTQSHIVFPGDFQTALPCRPVVFRFPSVTDSAKVRYRFVLSVPDGEVGNTITAWSTHVLAYGEGQGMYGREPLAGEILFDFSHHYDSYELVRQIDDYVLYRFKPALGRYQVVGGAVIAESDKEALGFLRAPTFDPRRLVVISSDDPTAAVASTAMGPRDNSKARLVKTRDSVKVYLVAQDGETLVHIEDEATFLANKFRWEQIETIPLEEFQKYKRVVEYDIDAEREAGLRVVAPEEPESSEPRVVSEKPTRIRLEIDRTQPGYLVIAQAFFPGWKARVNGIEKPVYRANYAFDAIELDKGKNDVEFFYAPDSLRHGLWITIASAVVGLIAVAASFADRRKEARAHSSAA